MIQREGGRIGVIIAKTKREKLLMTCFKEEGRFALLAFSCFEGIFEFMKNQFWAKELRYTDTMCKNERPKNFPIMYLIVNKILMIVIPDYGTN